MNRRAAFFSILILSALQAGYAQDHAWRIRYSGGYNIDLGINPLNPNAIFAIQRDDGSALKSDSLIVSYSRGMIWNVLNVLPVGYLGHHLLIHSVDTLLFFCYSTDLKRSSDYGLTWTTVLTPSSEVEKVLIDPILPDNMYAGLYDGDIYQSSDRGLNWEWFSHVDSVLCDLAIRPDSTNILYAGTADSPGKLWKSTDGGFTWRVTTTTTEYYVSHLAIDFFNPAVAYATTSEGPQQGVWKTTDGGELWEPVLTGYHGWYVDIDRSNPATVYVADDDVDAPLRSTNGGVSWESMEPGLPEDFFSSGIKVHPLNPDVVWFGDFGRGIYRWAPLVSSVNGIVLDDETGEAVTNGFVELASTGERISLDSSGGNYSFLYYQDDPMTTTIHVEAFPYYLHDEPIEFGDSSIAHDIEIARLRQTSIVGSVLDSTTQAPLSAEVVVSATSSIGEMNYMTTTGSDGSFLIDSLYVTYPPIINYESVIVNPAFPHSQRTVIAPVLDSTIFVLNLSLDTADVVITSSLGSGDFTSYYTSMLDSLGLEYHVWNSLTDGVAPLRRGTELRKGIVIYYTGNDSAALTVGELDSLSTALEAGVHMFITGQNFIESNDSTALVSQVLGVSHADNTSITACKGVAGDLLSDLVFSTSYGTGANNQNSRDIIQIEDSLVSPVLTYGTFGSYGFSAIRRDDIGGGARVVLFGFGFEAINTSTARKTVLRTIVGYLDGSIVVDVPGNAQSELPSSYRLEQNYPNPFNPKTDVRYEISDVGFVKLVVYDILGREVATLVNEKKSPGRYSVTWDASGQASGVYFCRLQAGNFIESRKLLLIR